MHSTAMEACLDVWTAVIDPELQNDSRLVLSDSGMTVLFEQGSKMMWSGINLQGVAKC